MDEDRLRVGFWQIAQCEVVVDRSGHRPVIVVRGGPPGVSLASNLAGLMAGIAWPGAALMMTDSGASQYEYRVPWDVSVYGRVAGLALVLGDLIEAVGPGEAGATGA